MIKEGQYIAGNCGAVAITALVIMLLLSISGAAMATVCQTELAMAREFSDGLAAHYLAEAGAVRAVSELSTNHGWPGINSWVYFDATQPENGQYKIKVESISGQPTRRKVTAYGKFNAAERQIVVWVTLAADAPPVVDLWRNF